VWLTERDYADYGLSSDGRSRARQPTLEFFGHGVLREDAGVSMGPQRTGDRTRDVWIQLRTPRLASGVKWLSRSMTGDHLPGKTPSPAPLRHHPPMWRISGEPSLPGSWQ
jgi:hypothetical protein